MKNSIEEDIELLQDETSSLGLFFKCKGSEKYKIALEHILSDYKRVLKENEILKEEKEQAWEEWNNLEQGSYETELKLKEENRELKADNYELNNRITDLLENIPIRKVKDKIEKEIKYHERNILEIENITMLKSKTAKEEAEIEFNKYAIVVLSKILNELIKERK